MSVPGRLKPLTVVIYAAFLGLLLTSYVAPLQYILEARTQVSALEQKLQSVETENTANKRLIEELNTPAGIERAARERYGMIRPGEKVYIIPKE
jgi:cell division protein FtsB